MGTSSGPCSWGLVVDPVAGEWGLDVYPVAGEVSGDW